MGLFYYHDTKIVICLSFTKYFQHFFLFFCKKNAPDNSGAVATLIDCALYKVQYFPVVDVVSSKSAMNITAGRF